MPKRLIIYGDSNGREPFTEWFDNLRDVVGRQRIFHRIKRLAQGNYGDYKPVGGGVNELRVFFGPGYRVYFAEDGKDIVILLCGGDKSSQQDDIRKAKSHWKEYNDRDKLPNS
jgi:putative addiction module killer protein